MKKIITKRKKKYNARIEELEKKIAEQREINKNNTNNVSRSN